MADAETPAVASSRCSNGAALDRALLPLETAGLHRVLVETDAEYRAARSQKIGGTLIATIGAGLGGAVLALGAMVYRGLRSDEYHRTDQSVPTGMMVGGGLVAGLSLLVGIPMAVQGSARMNRILAVRRELGLQLGLSVGARAAAATIGWRF